ncbi:MAG: TraX family protein [Porcipelethomonas sp.]
MESNQSQRIFPEKIRILSGSSLKLIALVSMLIDHTASVLLTGTEAANEPLFSIGGHKITIYYLCRLTGRIAFPIYAFLISEGYIHTGNKRKYGINLFLFALISEIPWNLEHTGFWFYGSQNVFFTLFLGYAGICAIEKYRNDYKKMAVCLTGLLLLSVIFKADYGCSGFGFIIFLYITRKQNLIQAIIGSCFLSSRWKAGLAFIPINMYNGKRGFIRGKAFKYIFYAAYPAHMLILFILKKQIFGY